MPTKRIRKSQYIEVNLDGWLFDDAVMQRWRDAVAEGIEQLGDEGVGIMASVIANNGLVLTGRTLRSVESVFKRAPGTTGFAKVQPTDTWQGTSGRPTLTWLDRGTRRGIRLRKSGNLFSRTTNALNNIRTEFMVNKLVDALGGD